MTTLIDLSQNIALLLSLTFIYGFIYPRVEQLSKRVKSVVNGLLFGVFGVISMTLPIQIAPGLFYDGRTIVICIAGIYGGVVPALIAAVMVGFYRVALGGVGVPGALASALTAALIGTAVHRYYEQRNSKPQARVLLATGILLALQGSLWGILLSHVSLNIIAITLPISIILYPLGVVLLGELINSQQRALDMEHALQENERRFKAIFDSTFQFTGLLSPDGTLLEANQAALEIGGVQLADVVGKPFWETRWWSFSNESQATLKEAIHKAAQGEFVRYEVNVSGAGGHLRTVDFSIKPVSDHTGKVVLLIPEGRDITTLKELEQQKVDLVLERERARLLKKFISDVSHDLRTPLSVIRLNLELLRRSVESPKHLQRIETLASQEQHLTRLLTDMMTMLTLDDDQGAFTLAPLDLNFVTHLVFDGHHSAAQRKQQTLTFTPAPSPLMIQADQVELERALGNFVLNALNYTPVNGSIILTTLAENDSAVIEIRDTGIGISSNDLPNIFQRFFRADQARSMDTGGTGLGLPIAKKIVEAHSGSIEVESTPEVGTVVRVLFPLSAEPNPETASLPEPGSAEQLLD